MTHAGPSTFVRRMRPGLGTFVEVGAAFSGETENAIADAFAEIERVQRTLSFHDPRSELSQLNRAAGKAVHLSPLTLRVLRLAKAMTRASRGLFNCTVGGALIKRGALPDHDGMPALATGDAQDIHIEARRACLRRPVRITLDGIAKGYAVDLAVRTLQRHGVQAGWVNAGGDLRAFGACTLPVVWRGMEQREGIGVCNAALATSAQGAHPDSFPAVIVDERAQRVRGTWSVLAHRAWRADALTKVAALAGDAERAGLVWRLGGRLVFARGS